MNQELPTTDSQLPTARNILFASDHAGFSLKEELMAFVRDELGFSVEDCGAYEYNELDDYPDYVVPLAQRISDTRDGHLGIVLGGSGQGEAMVANRFKGVRAAVFYGEPATTQTDATGEQLNIITSARAHNDANVLSIGARFVTVDVAKEAVQQWLETAFSGDERHVRRMAKVDAVHTPRLSEEAE